MNAPRLEILCDFEHILGNKKNAHKTFLKALTLMSEHKKKCVPVLFIQWFFKSALWPFFIWKKKSKCILQIFIHNAFAFEFAFPLWINGMSKHMGYMCLSRIGHQIHTDNFVFKWRQKHWRKTQTTESKYEPETFFIKSTNIGTNI